MEEVDVLKFKCADGNPVGREKIMKEIKEYSNMGYTVFIGTDSMLRSDSCMMATVIALHAAHGKIAKYFFAKERTRVYKKSEINQRMIEETKRSIDVALEIKSFIPQCEIEIHADVNSNEEYLSHVALKSISGWVHACGFDLKCKPAGWASSIADWHTK